MQTATHTVFIDGKELELCCEPDGYGIKPIVKLLPDGSAIVGYLSHDDDCQNPLEDCDGMGKIYDRRRNAARESREAFNEAMGIDSEGDHHPENQNRLAVLLDVYSHSGESWSLEGDGMQCRWDTSRAAGVWVPDPCCVEEIKSRAMKLLLPGLNVEYKSVHNEDGTVKMRKLRKGESTGYPASNGRTPIKKYYNSITWSLANGYSRGGYKNFVTAYQAAAKYMGIKFDKAALKIKEREAAVECAKQALESFNTWLIGDCWGVCVEKFNDKGERTKEEACWGHVGQKYAEAELASSMANYEKYWAKKEIEERAEAALKAPLPLFDGLGHS